MSRSYYAPLGLRLFNALKILSIPIQLAIKIQLAIEPHRVDRPGYPSARCLLVGGAHDQRGCLTLCRT